MNGLTEMTDFFQEYGKPTLRDCQAQPSPQEPPISPTTLLPTIVLSTKQILDLLTFKHTLSPLPQASAELCLALPPSPLQMLGSYLALLKSSSSAGHATPSPPHPQPEKEETEVTGGAQTLRPPQRAAHRTGRW